MLQLSNMLCIFYKCLKQEGLALMRDAVFVSQYNMV